MMSLLKEQETSRYERSIYSCDQKAWLLVDRLGRGSSGCQEASREELIKSLQVTLREALEFN
jgi:hypothetical protein